MRLKSVEWCGRDETEGLCRTEGGSDRVWRVVATAVVVQHAWGGIGCKTEFATYLRGGWAQLDCGARKRWGATKGEGDEFCSELAATGVAIAVRARRRVVMAGAQLMRRHWRDYWRGDWSRNDGGSVSEGDGNGGDTRIREGPARRVGATYRDRSATGARLESELYLPQP